MRKCKLLRRLKRFIRHIFSRPGDGWYRYVGMNTVSPRFKYEGLYFLVFYEEEKSFNFFFKVEGLGREMEMTPFDFYKNWKRA